MKLTTAAMPATSKRGGGSHGPVPIAGHGLSRSAVTVAAVGHLVGGASGAPDLRELGDRLRWRAVS